MKTKTVISNDVGHLTKSEKKVLDSLYASELRNVLYVTRTRFGNLLVYTENPEVKKRKSHKTPFRYRMNVYNKWGKKCQWAAGNIWSDEHKEIIDDFTRGDHRHGHTYN